MPRCKNCSREISCFDVDVCPYCGENDPIEPDYQTKDMTKFVDPVTGTNLYKSKSKLIYLLLTFVLGSFGAGEFYVGRPRFGAAHLLISMLCVGALGTGLFFVPGIGGYSFLIAFSLPFLYHAARGAYMATRDDLRDGHGEFLR